MPLNGALKYFKRRLRSFKLQPGDIIRRRSSQSLCSARRLKISQRYNAIIGAL